MSTEAAFLIYLGVFLTLALASCIADGWCGDDDPVAGVVIALLWPAFAALTIVCGPFWLAYKLGERLSDLRQALSSPEDEQ